MLPNNHQNPNIQSDPTTHLHDGRTSNEARFTDFPNNPDMYGHIDPYEIPNQGPDSLRDQQTGPTIGKFAPPGQFPTGFSPGAPINGVDGHGSLVMRGNGNPIRNGPVIHGDVDMMVENGVIPPRENQNNYPYGYDDDVDPFFSGGSLRRPQNPRGQNGPSFGPPPFRGPPGMGGPPGFHRF